LSKKAARRAVALACCAWHRVTFRPLHRAHSFRVLTYHRFGESRADAFCVSPEDFELQMRWVASRRLALSPGAVEGLLSGEDESANRGVLVTIDDGDESVYTHALPVLERYRIPALLFMVAGQVDQPGSLSQNQLQTLREAGVAIGSHTMTHPNLTTLAPPVIREELEESKHELEKATGCEVSAFAYPYGTRAAFNERVAQLVAEAGYRLAFTSQHGALRSGLDPMTLPRVKVEGGDPAWLFPWLCLGALDGWRWVDHWLWCVQSPLPLRAGISAPAAQLANAGRH
jgi:peptidoglycan/xylan/chitin deacetylase (PgdA/CDA1 family)